MKNNLLRVIALVISLLMVFTVAGCGQRTEVLSEWVDGEGQTTTVIKNNGGTQGSTSVDEMGGTAASGIEDTGDGKKGDSSYDLKGKTIVISAWGENDLTPKPTSSTYKEETDIVKSIEKKYNCKIEFKNIPDSMNYQNAWIVAAQAGTKFADVAAMATSWVWPAQINNGYVTPLDEYIDTKNAIFNQDVTEAMAINGKHYAISLNNRWYVGSAIFYNKSVLAKFGIPESQYPNNLVKANKWNWESFLDIARKCTGTLNGVEYSGFDSILAFPNNGVEIKVVNGKHVYEPDEKFIKGIQFAYDLYNTHGVIKGGKWEKGTVAMTYKGSWNATEYGEALGYENIGFTYLPMGPDAKDFSCKTTETTCYIVPSTCKTPGAAAAIMYDFFYPYKWRTTLEEKAEGMFGDKDSYNTYIDMAKRHRTDISLEPLYTYITRTVRWGENWGVDKQISPQAYIASVKAAAQAELDSVWAQ